MRNLKRFGLVLLGLILLVVFPVAAEDGLLLDDSDEDALFGGDEDDLFSDEADMVTVVEEDETGGGFEDIMLTYEAVEWGGDLSFSYTSSWGWQTQVPGTPLKCDYISENFTTPSSSPFTSRLGATMHFDARPAPDFRVLGKFEVEYPLEEMDTVQLGDVFRITELFADYNWAERLFFRVGKHTINWGVGYYFSPADILNLSPIDPDDPEAQREGPLSVKMNLPLNLHNLYLYLVANDITNPGGLAFAPKLELVMGSAELGLGAFFRPDMAIRPRVMATLTTGLGDFNLFGETVLSFGTEGNYLEESSAAPLGLEVVTREDQLFFEGTLGFLYQYSDAEQNWNVMATAQYLYTSKGYPDLDLIDDYGIAVMSLLGSGAITMDDLMRPARHYWGVNLNLSDILASDLSLGGFWLASADGSGQIIPSFSWNPDSDFGLSVHVPVGYGEAGSDYAPMGPSVMPGLELTLYEHTKVSLSLPLIFFEDSEGELVWQSGSISLAMSLARGGF